MGLYYYRHRQLSSQLGRFLSRDPFGSFVTVRGIKVEDSTLASSVTMTRQKRALTIHADSDDVVLDRLDRTEDQTKNTFPDGPNVYQYAESRPICLIDSTGESTKTIVYACIGGFAVCAGHCTCTWSRGNLGLALVMAAASEGCCQFSCLCGNRWPADQPGAMARCMNTFVRSMGGARAAPTSCRCT